MNQLFLSPGDAALRLGVSAKALRLYEDRGLLTPDRTQAGWRAYGPAHLARAEEIIALRRLGLSLTQVAAVLTGKTASLEPALAAHQAALESQLTHLAGTIDRIRGLRRTLASGTTPPLADLARLNTPDNHVAFDLPWPWDGERFEVSISRPLTWLTGPLGSGKTKLARSLASAIPGAVFLGLDRQADSPSAPAQHALDWLTGDGATPSPALTTLVTLLQDEAPTAFVVDLIEHGLDEPTQLALASWLRLRGANARPIFAMTRSSTMLDLTACGPDETVILCPANHSHPLIVQPHAGSPGHEAVTTCLAPPDVRARTEGVIAFRPPAA